MAQPGIMVSSTFYDLQQIRVDLREFIADDLGYNAILSEHSSFPVDPNVDTIENCRQRVKKEADMLVLVVGGRYGSIDVKSDKSITNLEYAEARNKGIPILIFVEKRILANLQIWEDNKAGDFSRIVDSPRLFAFVDQIRNQHRAWTFPFETAQDIVTVMRLQLANLFSESMDIYKKVLGAGTPDWHDGLSSTAIKLVLDKPDYWEFLLYLQVWSDETERRGGLFREYESGLKLRPPEQVPIEDAVDWIQTKLHFLKGVIGSANELVNVVYSHALKEDGVESDDEHLVWTAKYLGLAYEQLIEWSLQVKCAWVDEPFTDAVQEFWKLTQSAILQMQTFPTNNLAVIKKAINESGEGETPPIYMTIVFELSNEEPFNKAMEEAEKKY